MLTLTSRADIEQALADPRLVPLPAAGGPPLSMAWLRATVARFAHGEVHARRRAYVEAELARIDVDGLRRLAAGTLGGDRARVLRALARAMGLPDLDDAAIDALCTVADNYFGGDDPAADDAVRLVLPLMRTDDPEQAANRVGILIQACDATAALIAGARAGSGDVHATLGANPPVQVMRRIAIAATLVGDPDTIEIPEGETVLLEVGPLGLAFGHGPRACPGRLLALALAEGALENT
jgi:cytochrome P450